MPNKKYKIAVIQLNLNDVAENNLKKCLSWVRCRKSRAEVITLPELYSSHYFCQKTLTTLLWQSRFTAPRLLLSVL
jgi:N-carbamoylputrescine amidase